MQKMDILTSISHLFSVPTMIPASLNQSKWIVRGTEYGTAAGFAVAALPRTCESVMFFKHFHEQKRDCLPSSGPVWTVQPQ
jgi:hypothetical protein